MAVMSGFERRVCTTRAWRAFTAPRVIPWV
jgi:hypothetical protein